VTTFDSWHLRDGVKIWATARLRQPHVEMHERDGPLRVVLLADYEALMEQFEEVLHLLGSGAALPRECVQDSADSDP
jgi:hypothetical protein